MIFPFSYKYLFAALLLVVFLVLPAINLAYAEVRGDVLYSTQSTDSAKSSLPCGDCPCSDEQSSGCCDLTFCGCEFHVPLSKDLQLNYAPLIVPQFILERAWSLPLVYRAIVVPPQNRA